MNIKCDSRKVTEGDTFVAIKGNNYDGHDYIEDAIKRGASKIICEHGGYEVETVIVEDTREYLDKYLNDNYYDEIKDITMIGVTGTNGKTTTCYLIYELLNLLGNKTAYIGTIGFYIDKKIKDLDRTTPELLELYEMFLECKRQKVKTIVMEVSSHSLELNRVYGLKFDYAIFTNLTQDHLDYHKDMESYLNAKLRLFDKIKGNGYAIINIDDTYSDRFLMKLNKNITYGYKHSSYQIVKYKLSMNNTKFTIRNKKHKYNVKINYPGRYNIYNFLASIIVLNKMGYELKEIIGSLKYITLPKGRMDIVRYKHSIIIIDYAHTQDAVLNVLNSAMEFKKNNIYTIIGCGGDRDRGKRGEMGNIATQLSKHVIFTNDNPRSEDEKQIMDDITKNLKANNYEIIYDRGLAIKKGIELLKKKDILFILGKGHEDYQIIKDVKYHFDDKEEVYKNIDRE